MNYKIRIAAWMLFFIPLSAGAQKISLGSCTTKDGGQYKGEMVSGKPQGKGATVFPKMAIPMRAITSKASERAMAFILSLTARSMKDSGCRTSSTARVLSISKTIINT